MKRVSKPSKNRAERGSLKKTHTTNHKLPVLTRKAIETWQALQPPYVACTRLSNQHLGYNKGRACRNNVCFVDFFYCCSFNFVAPE